MVSPGRYGLSEMQILAEIDRARSRQLRAEQGRDQRAGPHAVNDDMAENVTCRILRVEMGRIDVAGHRREQLDVIGFDEAHQRGRVADGEFVEGAVHQQGVGRGHGS